VDPSRKIDIDAISYAPKVCLVSLGTPMKEKDPLQCRESDPSRTH